MLLDNDSNRLPMNVLSGFLDSSKTIPSHHILYNKEDRTPVIMNDVSEINIDAEMEKYIVAILSRAQEKHVEISNRSICFTLREDILDEIPEFTT